ncbi:gas vesicle protein [Enterobacter asburiae]|uniref:gas vesicle protein n=1 Tax=Enterobacter asburiae TaxID=61645 RepID=UPI00288AFE5A|nr:gas vesicle protein [Enterobacter asburiae]WNI62364.1 gas vesicle protein [Enterobacter asburiae]WNI69404.1 gas vesicle protein [Enterobacter asburiae]
MSDQVEVSQVEAFKVKDEDLLFLNKMVNRFDLSIGITLFSQGNVISGQLIPGKKYYALTAEKLKTAGTAGEVLAQFFEKKGAEGYTSEDPDFEYPNNFLHLESIKVQRGDGQMGPINNALLRIKIEETEGHIMGNASS